MKTVFKMGNVGDKIGVDMPARRPNMPKGSVEITAAKAAWSRT